ncbi:hypothetical protein BGW36DRAFT_55598 [Talaromyces proteolyticus]|uniref:Zn(2)-C6 fungal-type domain-containing protein n=1 Tax=Talaromyces proteolyticus TaxID=1131652 RepID=A0AAD4KM74_9EURO|nr:uncharacterized protein BGW36DRAFT_55598 [Talaromyces proteolyticus]KAH8691662.1 hypothetical protein BGW36DRAFT_55598 [Talaromyces proteolyticus]
MVRRPGMSLGCSTCRRRKIKCDETQPKCRRCLIDGRDCSGPVSGNVFLASDVRNPRKSTRIENNTKTSPQRETKTISSDTLTISNANFFMVPQASDLCQTQLVSCFLLFFGRTAMNKGKSQSWLVSCASDVDFSLLKGWDASISAAALALYVTNSQNWNAVMQFYEWYDRGIQYQHELLRNRAGYLSFEETERHVVYTILLAYCDAIIPTSRNSFSQHVKAAVALLCTVGPYACQYDRLHGIFLTLRSHMVHICLTESITTLLASATWTDIPFHNKSKRPLDFVIDFLLQLPSSESLPSYSSNIITEDSNINVLISLWLYVTETYSDCLCGNQLLTESETAEKHPFWDYVALRIDYRDSEVAVTLALYSLSWILVLANTPHSDLITTKYELIAAHCNTILTAAAFIDSIDAGCGYIRIVHPLRAIVLHSDNSGQKERAVFYLKKWGSKIQLLRTACLDLQ